MGYDNGLEAKKPNWMLVKEAAMKLYSSGKRSFTRKELVRLARQLDPSRPATSLDFEVDLVTVNSNSKDRYRSPEKLFLFRMGRGRYTLYDPEIHGPIEKYIDYQWYSPTRREVLESLLEQLKSRGLEAHEVKHLHKPLSPDIIAYDGERRLGVWIIDPGMDSATQLKALAYAIGSALLNVFDESIIAAPGDLIGKIPEDLKRLLEERRIRLHVLQEEKRYVIVF
jgi:hypothetical protein